MREPEWSPALSSVPGSAPERRAGAGAGAAVGVAAEMEAVSAVVATDAATVPDASARRAGAGAGCAPAATFGLLGLAGERGLCCCGGPAGRTCTAAGPAAAATCSPPAGGGGRTVPAAIAPGTRGCMKVACARPAALTRALCCGRGPGRPAVMGCTPPVATGRSWFGCTLGRMSGR